MTFQIPIHKHFFLLDSKFMQLNNLMKKTPISINHLSTAILLLQGTGVLLSLKLIRVIWCGQEGLHTVYKFYLELLKNAFSSDFFPRDVISWNWCLTIRGFQVSQVLRRCGSKGPYNITIVKAIPFHFCFCIYYPLIIGQAQQ